jgi:DNA-binding GntR family transcriptional regulator
MREEIQQGRLTIAQLQGKVEKDLASKYGVSRDTARKARKSVLSEFVGICRNLSNEK